MVKNVDHNQLQGQQTWKFSSSGWLFVYYLGVVKALRNANLYRNAYVVGSSGGAFAGICMFVNANIALTMTHIEDCAEGYRAGWLGSVNVKGCLAGAMLSFLPRDTGPAVNGRLEVSATVLPFLRNVRLENFQGKYQLQDAILASACVFNWPMHLPEFGWVLSGCFSDSQIKKALGYGTKSLTMNGEEPGVIAVSPFYMSRADIRPSKFIPPWWAVLPPTSKKLQDLYELGYQDTMAWLSATGQLPLGNVPAAQAVADSWGWCRTLLAYVMWVVICFELTAELYAILVYRALAHVKLVANSGESCKAAANRTWSLIEKIIT